ncbi:MAG TPA: TIGR03086 family metal-binding protein [Acidimicrobiales bacterium]
MVDVVELQRRGARRFTELVSQVDGRWDAPTPATEWCVRDLVNHVTVEQLWAPPLMSGATIAEVGDRFDGDVLGDDPVTVWDAAIAQATEVFSAPGALECTVHLSFGDTPGEEYVWQMVSDLHLHGWDLATALGEDDGIDPDAVKALLEVLAAQEAMLRGSGMFGSHLPVPDDADDQVRLLALVGRTPGGGL